MDSTRTISKVLGPVLLLRASSIVIDPDHFREMLRGLDREVDTVSFSIVPVAILMACISLAVVPLRSRALAALLIRLIAFGGIVKTSALIVFPRAVVAKAHVLEQAGFLYVVLAMSLIVGAYFTWFGYFASTAPSSESSSSDRQVAKP
jgi:hypothetical protein